MATMQSLMEGLHLHTVCQEARCPNGSECFSRKTATFLILGNACTRQCTFCAVGIGQPLPVDEAEPFQLLAAAEKLDLHYIVVTSVTRDDLPDGGAGQFARIIRLIREKRPGSQVEVLIPDFLGSEASLKTVVDASPKVINHNVETVLRLYPEVRPGADYSRSVNLLARVKEMDSEIMTKSGLMLGLGETAAEVLEVMGDLREAGCDLLTIGQYLQPSPEHHPVIRYVTPEEFDRFGEQAREMGFAGVAAAPLVRSSYQATGLYADAVWSSMIPRIPRQNNHQLFVQERQ
jgi:lipoic acid synthetase